jgi:hypothetical protein
MPFAPFVLGPIKSYMNVIFMVKAAYEKLVDPEWIESTFSKIFLLLSEKALAPHSYLFPPLAFAWRISATFFFAQFRHIVHL